MTKRPSTGTDRVRKLRAARLLRVKLNLAAVSAADLLNPKSKVWRNADAVTEAAIRQEINSRTVVRSVPDKKANTMTFHMKVV